MQYPIDSQVIWWPCKHHSSPCTTLDPKVGKYLWWSIRRWVCHQPKREGLDPNIICNKYFHSVSSKILPLSVSVSCTSSERSGGSGTKWYRVYIGKHEKLKKWSYRDGKTAWKNSPYK